MEMLPLVTGFAENAAKAFGLDDARSLRLGLAVEEIFVFIANQAGRGENMRLIARSGGYYVEIVCFLLPRLLPTRVMNTTATIDIEDEDFLAEMGVLLAARILKCMLWRLWLMMAVMLHGQRRWYGSPRNI